MSAPQHVRVERRHGGRVLAVVLASPKGNVIGSGMVAELRAAVAPARTDPTIAVLLLEADGDHFSYGASVPEHRKEEAPRLLGAFHALLRELVELPAPTVASVRGMCLGGALELVAACDMILAEDGSAFGVPEITLGVFPPAACALLPARIGSPRASELILTGRRLEAEQARAAGLVNQVFPKGSLAASTSEWFARSLLPHSTSSLRLTARAARLPWAARFAADLAALERLYLGELMETADANEGIAAFLEKRKPRWADGGAG